MNRRHLLAAGLLAVGMPLTWTASAAAQAPPQPPSQPPSTPAFSGTIQVTATRVPEDVEAVPASIQVIRGDELRDRGAGDLAAALALLAGVDVAPGGDGGPAASVPEFWGLKEFDAFLLVVDGVPWGGAFNPDLATLDLSDVERIEVQRGPAPVMYGATSFVGVVQVIHRTPGGGAIPGGAASGTVSGSLGTHGSGGASVAAALPSWLGFDSRIVADYVSHGFEDDRTSFDRGHLLWRNRRSAGAGSFHFDVDATVLDQQPASPSLREGRELTSRVPIDSNQNPPGARLDEDRTGLRLGYDRDVGSGAWSTVLSFTRSTRDQRRGFLGEASSVYPNADGFDATIEQDDLYFDTHLATTGAASWRAVVGLDYLWGDARADGETFEYGAPLDGHGAFGPVILGPVIPGEGREIRDRRGFAGLYANLEWTPSPAWRLEGGLRLSRTEEERREEGEAMAPDAMAPDSMASDAGGDQDKRTDTRLSGGIGATFTAWHDDASAVRLFANAKSTFKPAAIDFNLAEAGSGEGGGGESGGILEPETAWSYEAGLRADLAGGAVHLELAGFRMDFDNLVIARSVGGLPALANAGQARFQGVELSGVWTVAPRWTARGSVALHDARFRDYETAFDGVPARIDGNRLEMSPRELASLALTFSPPRGVFASAETHYVGSRYLNKRNTAEAGAYTTVAALVGWRAERYELRLTGRNLTDRRDPVSESELGDAQYYRLPARQVDLTAAVRF